MENNKEDIDTPDQLVFGLAKNLANNLGVPVFVGDNDKIKEGSSCVSSC